MIKWRYLEKEFDGMPREYELDKYGANGWELVAVVKTGEYKYSYFFKKVVEDDPTRDVS